MKARMMMRCAIERTIVTDDHALSTRPRNSSVHEQQHDSVEVLRLAQQLSSFHILECGFHRVLHEHAFLQFGQISDPVVMIFVDRFEKRVKSFQ